MLSTYSNDNSNAVTRNMQGKQRTTSPSELPELYRLLLIHVEHRFTGSCDYWGIRTQLDWENFHSSCANHGIKVTCWNGELTFTLENIRVQLFEAIGQETDLERLASLLDAANNGGFVYER